MFTKTEVRPLRVYRVLFEHKPTGIMDYIFAEGTSSNEVSSSIMDRLGQEYDLIICVSVKKIDLN